MKKKDEYADPSWTLNGEFTPARLKELFVKIPPCETSYARTDRPSASGVHTPRNSG